MTSNNVVNQDWTSVYEQIGGLELVVVAVDLIAKYEKQRDEYNRAAAKLAQAGDGVSAAYWFSVATNRALRIEAIRTGGDEAVNHVISTYYRKTA